MDCFMRSFALFFKLALILKISFFSYAAFASDYKGFLWKVQYQQNTVFIAGSIHALSSDFYPLPTHIINAFNQSQRLAVELDPNELDPYQAQQLVQARMWLPEGQSLDQYLSKPHLDEISSISQKLQTPYKTALKMRPWMLIENLTQLQIKESGYHVVFGVDNYFLNHAKQKNMPILELESLEEQISAIADSPFQSQLAALRVSLDDLYDQTYLPKMATLWKQGKDKELYEFVYSDVRKTPELKPMMEQLLDKRNRRMADIIGIYLNQPNSLPTTTFVVVGALHLSGPESIIEYLKQKGFYIQRVSD